MPPSSAVVRLTASMGLAWLTGVASAAPPPGLTRDEAVCQRAFGPATDRFGAGIARCVVRCDAKAVRGRVPASDCTPPYGAVTQACIARARASEARRVAQACDRDCPECYAGGNCLTYTNGALDVTALVVDRIVRPVLCDDAASTDRLSRAELRCRRATGSALARAAVKFGSCYVKCRQRTGRGGSDVGSQCTAASARDARVEACLQRATNTARRTVKRRCADPPECLPDPAVLLGTVFEQIRSDYDVLIFCASPSGAFVDAR